MPTDFSDYTGLVPAGTVAVLRARLRHGDGADGVLKKTRNGDAEGLDFELTVVDGPYAKSKLFWFALVTGTTDGQKAMVERNRALLKKSIDSAKFLDPNDRSPEARQKRTLSWRDFDGLTFLAEVGVEEGRDGYADKNVVGKIITRDMPAWNGRSPLEQPGVGPVPASTAAQAAPQETPPVVKPAWAS
jgi:hypothetical protein